MCKYCNIIKTIFKEAKTNPHIYYSPVIYFLSAMEKSEKIELFAGDCLLKDANKILLEEKHYTVCHYIKCKSCSLVFFIGACIRGEPLFKVIKNIERENIQNRIWGNVGIYYNR